jgi:hypothetical protein
MTDLATILTHDGEIEVAVPEPGERCMVCDRRVPKPRQEGSPTSRRLVVTLPSERAASVEEGLENLQAYVGADLASYPRGTVLELLLILGGQHREALKAYFDERSEL